MKDLLKKPFLRVDEVAEILVCHQNTVRLMITDGRLPAVRPNYRYLIPSEAVQKLLEKSKVKNE